MSDSLQSPSRGTFFNSECTARVNTVNQNPHYVNACLTQTIYRFINVEAALILRLFYQQ